jgi:hypothetical protein
VFILKVIDFGAGAAAPAVIHRRATATVPDENNLIVHPFQCAVITPHAEVGRMLADFIPILAEGLLPGPA